MARNRELHAEIDQSPLTNAIEIPAYEGTISKVFKSALGLEKVYTQYQDDLKQWPVAYREIMLQSPFGKTYCLRCGDIDNPPIVMLHGLAVKNTGSGLELCVPYAQFKT